YEYLDPQVSYYSFDYNVMQNVYENLLWYAGTSGTTVIPWLASSYSLAANGKTATFTLRSNIHFADGEALNSTAVYFSLNRLLVADSSAPAGHDSQASWIVQQLLNTSLSSVLSGTAQAYNAKWVQQVINQNFVQITGTNTFTLNLQNPNAAFPYLLAGEWSDIIAPDFIMTHDISTWKAAGYTLPYTTLSGNSTQMIYQYFVDMASTCNTGATPSGCGATYLDNSVQGSLAGTGPYTISSVVSSGVPTITLAKNTNYWGGPSNNMTAHIPTIVIKQVQQETTRELDLQAAAKSGQAVVIDVEPDSFYDVANKADWLSSNQMVSIIPGVSLYGPYTYYSTLFDPYVSNATNPFTGNYYSFQPFADQRIRQAFSDSVNMTDLLDSVANGLGVAANSAIPPNLPPAGVYNASLGAGYSFNPDKSASLLLNAMEHPLTSFTFENGTKASASTFNNAFGCTTLSSSGTCSNPIQQSIVLYDAQGDTIDDAILTQVASSINNISLTYNLGLTVSVSLVPSGPLVSEGLSGHYYMYALGWFADYPWSIDFSEAMYAPGGAYMAGDGWNYTALTNLENQASAATESGNLTGLVKVTNLMSAFVDRENLYLWTQFPIEFTAMTSNVAGFQFNPALSTDTANVAGPQLFAPLY
ncbi:MAG: ABC transporter substrate-binding protein, partial [Nitrososphaerales archaeon]